MIVAKIILDNDKMKDVLYDGKGLYVEFTCDTADLLPLKCGDRIIFVGDVLIDTGFKHIEREATVVKCQYLEKLFQVRIYLKVDDE